MFFSLRKRLKNGKRKRRKPAKIEIETIGMTDMREDIVNIMLEVENWTDDQNVTVQDLRIAKTGTVIAKVAVRINQGNYF